MWVMQSGNIVRIIAGFLFAILMFYSPSSAVAEELTDNDTVNQLVRMAIASGDMPGCVIWFGTSSQDHFTAAFGDAQIEPAVVPMSVDMVFDLASLTKPIATATSISILIAEGKLNVDDKASSILPEFNGHNKEAITIENLLVHTSGLTPDNALSDYQSGEVDAWRAICELPLRSEPGAEFKYSDVGFIVLGKVVEKVSGDQLDDFCKSRIFMPLNMADTGYRRLSGLAKRTSAPIDLERDKRLVPTERRNGQWLQGKVHDPRAALLDGVAGHAGLFSCAKDLAEYARAVLFASHNDNSSDTFAQAVRVMSQSRSIDLQVRSLGWDMRSAYSSNRGDAFSDAAFGHGGFTGTVLWIDPKSDSFFIFLSSRLHPDGKGSVNALAGKIATHLWKSTVEAKTD